MTPEALELEKTVTEAIRDHIAVSFTREGTAHVLCVEDAARAALAVVREKMREPTPEMIEAGTVAGKHGASYTQLWRRMIAASPLGGDT